MTVTTQGTIADLPTPLARAWGVAMSLGLIVDYIDEMGEVSDVLGVVTYVEHGDGVREALLLPDGLSDEQTAAALTFACALLTLRSTGADMTSFLCRQKGSGETAGMIVFGRTPRPVPTEGGFGNLSAKMGESIGLSDPAVFDIIGSM